MEAGVGVSSEILLAASREWRGIFDALRDAVCWVSPAGVVQKANAAFARMVGQPVTDLIGKPCHLLVDGLPAGCDGCPLVATFHSKTHTEATLTLGDRLVRATADPVLDETGALVGAVHVFSDVTDHMRAEAALAESERRFREFVEHALVGVYRTTPDGRVLMANSALARMLGFRSVETLVANDIEEWAAASRYPRTRFKQALGADGLVDGFESTFVRGNGCVTHLRESARAVRDQHGEIMYFEGFVEDLTRQKSLEGQLLQAQRMEAVGRLAGGVAHDFNNILQAMLSQSQLMRLRLRVPERLEAAVCELEQEIRRGAALTRQLLLFSRRETVKPERLDLNEVVQAAMTMLRRLLRENVVLVEEMVPEPLPVDGDRGQLDQVLLNLVVNGADAMPEGGTLTIRTAWLDGGHLALQVQDTGEGIPDEIRERIFEPFFTTKSAEKGTGLGLSVVHGIVALHGGRIEVESAEGRGSTFTVVFPRAGSGEFPAVKEGPPTASAAERGQGERVLVVEDEGATRRGLQESLRALGYQVVSVGSGEDAGRLPANPPFDLLLTDLVLPGISGAQLAKGLRDRWPKLSVVLMSGYTDDDAVRREVRAGEVHFLQKPFEIGALARELRAALSDSL